MMRLLGMFAAGEAASVSRRVKAAIIAYAVIALCLFIAIIFLLIAAYIAASIQWGPLNAAIWFGIGFLLIASLTFLVYNLREQALRRRAVERRKEALASGASLLALPLLAGKKGVRRGGLLILAALAGYALYNEASRKNRRR